MKTITTPPAQDHYRVIPSQNFYGFPDDFDQSEWKISAYLQGERANLKHCLSLSCFDTFSFHGYSVNDKTGKQFMHVLGYRIKENTTTILILERI